MKNISCLVSWVGAADHECAEGTHGDDIGPIATALMGSAKYDRVYLLTNYDFERSKNYCSWLENLTGYASAKVDLYSVDLISPIDYTDIYNQVSQNLTQAGLPKDEVSLTFHLSPGTPAMAAIWIILAKTRFPAKLIQTSRNGGIHSVDFPFDLASDFLPEFLQRSGERVTRLANVKQLAPPMFEKIVHACPQVAEQIQLARRIAVFDVPVLILGETGTGKELFAEAIHAASSRADGPFIAVNCGALSSELANSELFGHKKGAFTGADTARKGHFLSASGGTLFLDEIGDLPMDTQVRLLRALQSQEITPLGQSTPVKVNTRVVAATHRDLIATISANQFREDLFHRLAVGILRLPPLRKRGADVRLLATKFMDQINADAADKPEAQHKDLSEEALFVLEAQTWPGNVRELYHTLLRAVIWSNGNRLTAEDVRVALLPNTSTGAGAATESVLHGDQSLQSLLDAIATKQIEQAVRAAGGRKALAAKRLGFANHQTLGNWMKKLGIDVS
jgi:DNA-binding NtrC family response regulator